MRLLSKNKYVYIYYISVEVCFDDSAVVPGAWYIAYVYICMER